jgi:hypothetical protein
MKTILLFALFGVVTAMMLPGLGGSRHDLARR